ncbi:hypothetical protein [Comamonas sp.]|uniref:hypothetical protein n=1 Tax=Comamonas sp. TaxID=34028 RepID=UPI003A8D3176
MSIRNKNKDHLKEQRGVELVALSLAPTSEDPLRFWTNHPTSNTLVDLHDFANGAPENTHPTGGGKWSGPFSGRPELIAELAPAIQARLALAARSTWINRQQALRAFWRVCDELEATTAPDGQKVERLTSVRDINHLHEAAMHRARVRGAYFSSILSVVNDARRLMRLGPLLWASPKDATPKRRLIPDSHAKAIKIGIKRDWERVRKTWVRHDAIRRGEDPDTLTEFEKQDPANVLQYAKENARLRAHLLHFARIQEKTGMLLPSGEQLYDGMPSRTQYKRGLFLTQMRAIAFPTAEDAHIAFHAALMGSGWNPSTLITGIDATLPERIFQHPKDTRQSVLAVDVPGDEAQEETDNVEVTMQGRKLRAGGRLQFCTGLKKNPDSPPNIVAAYLERTKVLREQLRLDVRNTHAELARLKAEDAPKKSLERQFKKLETLQKGVRNVWLYVSMRGNINWLDGRDWRAFQIQNGSQKGSESYLDQLIARLNGERAASAELPITQVVTSDLRDIFARWVHLQTGGNIIAVMFALGHAGLRSTNAYLENNIFSAENDETMRRFMTHFFKELEGGRVDLTILSQLVRHGPLTPEMQKRLMEYRRLMRSRVKAGCADPKHPPAHIEPEHIKGKWCGTHHCLRDCPNARFLPESLDGIAMRVEELLVMSEHLPFDTWIQGDFEKELAAGEYLLNDLYASNEVAKARMHWHNKIRAGKHVVPHMGIVGLITEQGAA